MSTRMLADSGIEFTEVPPRITPTLKVVLGDAGTGVWANACTARDSTTMGLGAPKVAPGMSAGTAHDHLETAAAQGLGHDGVGARAIQHQAVVNLVLPARLRENVAHAPQVAFAFFPDIADKE